MVCIFSDSFLNIMNGNIPNKIVNINDSDAPWVTPEVKSAMRRNEKMYEKLVKKGINPTTKGKTSKSQALTNRIVSQAKIKYINDLGHKICDPNTGHKTFWSAFKRLSNKKKITNIPSIVENCKFISNFKHKADLFNSYFVKSLESFPM